MSRPLSVDEKTESDIVCVSAGSCGEGTQLLLNLCKLVRTSSTSGRRHSGGP